MVLIVVVYTSRKLIVEPALFVVLVFTMIIIGVNKVMASVTVVVAGPVAKPERLSTIKLETTLESETSTSVLIRPEAKPLTTLVIAVVMVSVTTSVNSPVILPFLVHVMVLVSVFVIVVVIVPENVLVTAPEIAPLAVPVSSVVNVPVIRSVTVVANEAETMPII